MGDVLALRGIIVPCSWDEQDNVISIAISAFDEKEYPIEMNGMGRNLMKHITHEVRLEGYLRHNVDLDRELLSVEIYELLN